MTNAEKYLKDGVSPKAMWYEFKNWYNDTQCTCAYGEAIEIFMKEPVKPTLTEDEKVILRNIREAYSMIGKDEYEDIVLKKVGGNIKIANWAGMFKKSLFQFIKPRRRI